MKNLAALFFPCLLISACAPAATAPPAPVAAAPPAAPAAAPGVMPPRGKFVYSDLCSGPRPWEVHGHRVELLHDSDGNFITIEFGDAGFDFDVRHAQRAFLDEATGEFDFDYDDYLDDYSFQGSATPRALTGLFGDDLQVHTLPRVPNSWPDQPPCRPLEDGDTAQTSQ